MQTRTDYTLEPKNGRSDFTKKQILRAQENAKVLLPLLLLTVAGGTALNVANALRPFLSTYLTVLINAALVGAGLGIAWALVSGDRIGRAAFGQLEETVYAGLEGEYALYVYDSDSAQLLKDKAEQVRFYRDSLLLVPQLPQYRHRLFTNYRLRCDFGRLRFPADATVTEEGQRLVISCRDLSVTLRQVSDGKDDRRPVAVQERPIETNPDDGKDSEDGTGEQG